MAVVNDVGVKPTLNAPATATLIRKNQQCCHQLMSHPWSSKSLPARMANYALDFEAGAPRHKCTACASGFRAPETVSVALR